LLNVSFSTQSHALDPFTAAGTGVAVVKGLGGLIGLGKDAAGAAEMAQAIADLAKTMSTNPSLSEEGADLDRQLRETEELVRASKTNGHDLSNLLNTERHSAQTLTSNIKYLESASQNFKRLITLLGLNPKRGAQLASAQKSRTSKQILGTQSAILYQMTSDRLEQKREKLKFSQEMRALLVEDKKYRRSYSRKRGAL